MGLSKKAINELKTERRRILAEPRLFNMDYFADRRSCGTVHCIAGGISLRHGGHVNESQVKHETRAMLILDIPSDEAAELFWVHLWERGFKERYEAARSIRGNNGYEYRAQIAADYIDWYIEKYK